MNKKCDNLIDIIVFLITLILPGYLLLDKYFSGLEKFVLSVFLSLAITSSLYYFVVSFFGISRELIYFYSFVLLLLFFLIKKPTTKHIIYSIKKIKLNSAGIQRKNWPELLGIFILVFSLSLIVFFISINQIISFDDYAYHLPIIYDIADDGKKTFFSETYNIYRVRSNQFPLLYEFFVGTTNFFVDIDFFRFISFFSLIISLFLVFFISKEVGYVESFSLVIYGLTPMVLILTRYFGVENFLSMFFLGSVFFILKFIRKNNFLFLGVSGFLAGLMFLTKFTGGIFFVGLLLFLFYKRKFKASVFFALIFILVSSVFFVSHFGVPFDEVGAGSYGKISGSPSVQIPLNIFRALNVLLFQFSNNNFVFFVPFLFLLGLWWLKEKDKDFFILLFISLSLFLFVNFITAQHPTYSGLPRYFLPVYSLLCIFAGIQLKKIVLLKDKRILVFFGWLFVLSVLFTSVYILGIFNTESR